MSNLLIPYLRALGIPLDLGFLTNYWMDDFLVVLIASVVSILAVEEYREYRKRTKIEIEPRVIENRVGFAIRPKGGTLHRPQIIYCVVPQDPRMFSHKCELYDEDGNIYKKDYILGGDSVCVFPFILKEKLEKSGEKYTLQVEVLEESTKSRRTELWFEAFTLPTGWNTVVPKEHGNPIWEATLRIYADGWGREQIHVLSLSLSVLLLNLRGPPIRPSSSIEDWTTHYTLSIKRQKFRSWLR